MPSYDFTSSSPLPLSTHLPLPLPLSHSSPLPLSTNAVDERDIPLSPSEPPSPSLSPSPSPSPSSSRLQAPSVTPSPWPVWRKEDYPQLSARNKPIFNLWIMEHTGHHENVIAAVLHSFGAHPEVQFSLHMVNPYRFSIHRVTEEFEGMANPIPPPVVSTSHKWMSLEYAPAPQILVIATCKFELFESKEMKQLYDKTRCHVICLIHNADYFTDTRVYPRMQRSAGTAWINSGRLTFMATSPHTVQYIKDSLKLRHWNRIPKAKRVGVRTLISIFPLRHYSDRTNYTAFTIQGNFDPYRRNYDALYSRFANMRASVRHEPHSRVGELVMELVGSGQLVLPPDIEAHSAVYPGLPYPEYYELLSKSIGVMPVFSDDKYYTFKGSSSVTAATISGVPLFADEKLLEAYKYLDESVVWFVNSTRGETDIDVLKRLVEDPNFEDLVETKKKAVRERCMAIADRNRQLAFKWVEELVATTQPLA